MAATEGLSVISNEAAMPPLPMMSNVTSERWLSSTVTVCSMGLKAPVFEVEVSRSSSPALMFSSSTASMGYCSDTSLWARSCVTL